MNPKPKQNKFENNIININKNKFEYKCIYCSKKSIKSYQCNFCGSYACKNCYLLQFSIHDSPQCTICSGKSFKEIKEDNFPLNNNMINNNMFNNNNMINNNMFNNNMINNNMFNNNMINNNMFNNNMFNNNMFNNNIITNNQIILKNNLNYYSKTEINQIIKIYKNEMIKIMKNNFNKFTEEQAKKIYVYLLEKFNQNNKNIKVNIQEAMKSKEQIKKEAIEAIKQGLNEIPKENFLRASTSLLFKEIIGVFQKEMINKIYEFIKGLNKNKEIQMIFKSIDIFEPNKEIKISNDFKKYIEMLKQIEKNSFEKNKDK